MRNTLFFVLLLIVSVASAQDVKVTWGQLSNDKLVFKKIIPVSKGFIKLTLKKEGKGKNAMFLPILTSYDENLNEVKSVTLPTKKEYLYTSLFKLGNNLYAFVRNVDNDDNGYIYYAQRINQISLEPTGDMIPVGTFYYPERDVLLKDFFTYSPDSTKILFKGYQEKKSKVCIPAPCKYPPLTVHIFDENMTKLLVKRLDEVPADTHVHTIQPSNKGELIIYYSEAGAKKSISKSLLKIYSPDGTIKEIRLPESDMQLQELSFINKKGNDLFIYGQFRKPPYSWSAGIFTATLNINDAKFTINQTFLFDKSLLDALANDDLTNKNNTIAAFFKPAGIIKGNDGSIFYTLEYKELPILDHPSNSFTSWNWYDIISLSVDANGSSTFTRIPKYQTASSDEESSIGFVMIPYKNQALFFYMDRKKNLEKDPLTSPSYKKGNLKNLSLVMASVDANGKLTRKIIVEEFDKKFSPSMIYSYVVSNNKILLIGEDSQLTLDETHQVMGILEIN